jgi:hypothetical protein
VFYPILSSLSIAMFILMLSLMGVILDSRYSCDQYTKVGVALLGVTVIYFVDIVLYWLLVYMGWRGTPLNESKRMPQMAILGMWLIILYRASEDLFVFVLASMVAEKFDGHSMVGKIRPSAVVHQRCHQKSADSAPLRSLHHPHGPPCRVFPPPLYSAHVVHPGDN